MLFQLGRYFAEDRFFGEAAFFVRCARVAFDNEKLFKFVLVKLGFLWMFSDASDLAILHSLLTALLKSLSERLS